jgi:hypothetical protein
MGMLKVASIGLVPAVLFGCSPGPVKTAGTPTACLKAVNTAFVDGAKSCDVHVAQAVERAKQAFESSLPPEPVPVLEIPPFGAALPGSPWSAVKDFKRNDACLEASDHVDCLVTDANGIDYLVFDTSVATVTARASAAAAQVKLPFGLAFGDSLKDATGKLTEAEKRMSWLISKASGSEVVLSSAEEFKGADGYGFTLILKFKQGRLAELEYFRHVT